VFKITQGKGFFITFENGYSLSVQWGYGNYCANRHEYDSGGDYVDNQRVLGEEGSNTAEIAIINPDGDMNGKALGIFDGDDVEGYCTPERVLEVMNLIAALEKSDD
jgi:hypothetical protein